MERRTIGDRVKVSIKHAEEWALGAAEALDGKFGKVDEVQTEHRGTQLPLPLPQPRYLVMFDMPAAAWSANHAPTRAFWFDAEDLEALCMEENPFLSEDEAEETPLRCGLPLHHEGLHQDYRELVK